MSRLQADAPPLVLASGSAARRAVLAGAGLAFETVVPRIDEDAVKAGAVADGLSPDETAVLLSELKAQRVARRDPAALVIGADQILVCEGRRFDKPADPAGVRAHLEALRGRTHTLVTAMVCLQNGQRIWHHVAHPRLTMRAFSEPFLDAYLAIEAEAAMASVGGYRLEGIGAQLFDRIEGEHSAILGLPLLPLLGFLRQHGAILD